MKGYPGVVFIETLTGGRRAALASGPEVWTVVEARLQHDEDGRTPAIVADALGISVADVETAVAYWADFPGEIDDLIYRHRATQDEALASWERRRAR